MRLTAVRTERPVIIDAGKERKINSPFNRCGDLRENTHSSNYGSSSKSRDQRTARGLNQK
jgi:hypothetical protein